MKFRYINAICLQQVLPFYRFIPESPRWLLAMGKVDETMEVLQKAAKVNKHPLPENMDKIINQVNYYYS